MADTIQFESFDTRSRGPECMACEEQLPDALDGLLSPAELAAFEGHLAACPACAAMFSEAREGAAWLTTLAAEAPEPPAGLLDRILAQTAALHTPALQNAPSQPIAAQSALPLPPAQVFVFPRRPAYAASWQRASRLMLEPRLAMTAAMAFFSIALTMSLTGVRLRDLNPTSLRHNYYATSSSAVRFYDNLRVVHVLESRLDDLRQAGLGNLDTREDNAGARPHRDPRPQPTPEGNGPARRLEWSLPSTRPISTSNSLARPQGGRA